MYAYRSHYVARSEAINIPTVVKILLAVAVVLSLMATNPLLTFVSLCAFILLAKLTWLRSEPPILFFAVSMQWLQVSAAVFYANLQGRVLGSRPDPPNMEQAFWFGMIGLIVLAAGMRMASSRSWGRSIHRLELDPSQFSLQKIWRIYLVLFLLANILPAYLWLLLPLRSLVLAVITLRWVSYFALAYISFVAGKGLRQPVLLLAALLELILGFAGYFSGFKLALFVLMIAFLSSKVRLRNRDILPVCAIIAVTLFLAIVWTAVKFDYRDFLNQGTGKQVITVGLSDRLIMITDLALDLKVTDFARATETLLSRIAYIEMFAYVLDYVPRVKEHEEGWLWFAAMKHIALPRILFSDKAALPSDSVLTMKYTGLRLASAEQGTSISMGYMAESYIDFGIPLMFVPIFLLGYLWGVLYRYFIDVTPVKFMGYGFAMIVLMGAIQFEIHSVKLLGGVLTNFIVLALLNHFFLRRHIHKFLINQ